MTALAVDDWWTVAYHETGPGDWGWLLWKDREPVAEFHHTRAALAWEIADWLNDRERT